MRRLLSITVLVASTLWLTIPASAHGDEHLFADRLRLEPGEKVTAAGGVHYHRLVGRFTATGPILVTVAKPAADRAAFTVGPGTDLAVNELIPCCDDATWTSHEVTIENVGDSTIEVDARASLVHDDVAVSVFRAESGVVESMLVLGAAWAYAMRRRRRRGATTSRRRALTSATVLGVTVLSLGLYGAATYGGGSVPGLLAGLADVPIIPTNPLVSRASLLLGLVMIGWAVVGAHWASSRDESDRRTWLVHGSMVVGMVLVAAVAVSSEYGTLQIPVLIGTLALAPITVVLWMDGRSETTTPDGSRRSA